MSNKNSPDVVHENHTLEILNQGRVKMIKTILESQGRFLEIPDEQLMRYLSDISPDLRDIHLLGLPDEVMPREINNQETRKTLYMFDEEDDAERLERMLLGQGISEENTIASMRVIYFYLAQMIAPYPKMPQVLALNLMERTLKERVIFLAGKYDFVVPEAWIKRMPRERIQELLLLGIQDLEEYAEIDEVTILDYEKKGKTVKDLEEDIAFVNNSEHRNMSLFLADFLRRRPDPADYACQLLDVAEMERLMSASQEVSIVQN